MNHKLRLSITFALAACLASVLLSIAFADIERKTYPRDSIIWGLDFHYVLTDGQATIIGWEEWSSYDDNDEPIPTIVSLPEELDGYLVTRIGEQAFWESEMDGVVIPDSITSIGEAAFIFCEKLASITIPESVVSIGDYVFGHCCSLTEIELPSGITVIGEDSFLGCTSLNSIIIPEGVVSIGEQVFGDCSSLTNITIPSGVTVIKDWTFSGCSGLTGITLPDRLESIGYGAFMDCAKLTDIALPHGVASIDESAFKGCTSLASVTVPPSVIYIGDDAFAECPNLTLTVAEDSYAAQYAEKCELPYTYNPNLLLSIPAVDTGDNVEQSGKNFSFVWENEEAIIIGYNGKAAILVIPDMLHGQPVTGIGMEAFMERKDIISVTLPDSIVRIGTSAFEDCPNLVSINLPESVNRIDDYAFDSCNSLILSVVKDSYAEQYAK